MKKTVYFVMIFICVILTACGNNRAIEIVSETAINNTKNSNKKGEKVMYDEISPQEEKKIIDSKKDILILDVREQDEFNEGHIQDAILIPYTEIKNKAIEMLPDKDKLILVYCRSGRRSKIAAESLVELGYTNIKEFGGIIDWPYEIEK